MLKDFQRDTVAYVMDRYFGPDPTRRFLIADETGLGKSVVAGGIIADLIDRLRDDDKINRIDIVYICSNQDIAGQNLERLAGSHPIWTGPSRLTLLGLKPLHSSEDATGGKPVNFVAFTPGTSLDSRGRPTGRVDERALLHCLLDQRGHWGGWKRRAAMLVLQGASSSFDGHCSAMAIKLANTGFDPVVRDSFDRIAMHHDLYGRFDALVDDLGRRREMRADEPERARKLTGELRSALAQAGVAALEPDLIVLDEFQRFRNLLDQREDNEAAELARHLFDYPESRLLLLSATPYKPFSYAEETDDHHADLHVVLRFLCPDEQWNQAVRRQLGAYRDAMITGAATGPIRSEIRRLLLPFMCRTELPARSRNAMLSEHVTPATDLDAAEIRSYVAMKQLGAALKAPVTLDYWKSVPYFLNFVEGYLFGKHLQDALRKRPEKRVRELLDIARLLNPEKIAAKAPIELGNSRLRKLAEQTVGDDWWQLLWMPPSMPYYRLEGPFQRGSMTKRLVFSSWNATPTAVSALLSYDAESRVRDGRPDPARARLDYRISRIGSGRPAAMSTFALFWPHPGLAEVCDPQNFARGEPDRLMSLAEIEAACRDRLRDLFPDGLHDTGHVGELQPWRAVLRWPGARPADLALEAAADVMHNPEGTDEAYQGLRRHVEHAYAVMAGHEPVCARPEDVLDDLVSIGMHAPANVAWRALRRLVTDRVTPQRLWHCAAAVADGLHSLFNKVDSMLLLDKLDLGSHYWQAVLRYCAVGGLQAVLDEYLHVLNSSATGNPLDDDSLWKLAVEAWEALTLRPAPYVAFNPLDHQNPIRITGRFALRYGGRGDDEAGADRAKAIRAAFNSPFWPFVVSTTSAGQEGIDFHSYCSAVVHWNTPANPVDFEQREGRVQRFGGHAVRRNVAAGHRAAALRSDHPDIWKAAYDAARKASEDGDFTPYWICPGPVTTERHLLPLPLSRDEGRYRRLQRDLAMYRLTFGQPRQEDMLQLLTIRDHDTELIDLRPPPSIGR
ncbi:DEAD/DEAH box helicase [Actinoplanes sp. NBRC 101535]|uniref:DEAD/DEAH box helicase n=1 Tax=Actinoplanes sp. NBRC 101535 TaxID=3032196 RepID=UPI0024A2203C|nr:DEAD/DEAH box helicase [Actinoplanes sp. NBRC 101535]GLY03136.1 helicase [Actinoplanes sp. NBRC 101535]